jgi:hypothetical protein
MTEWHLTFQEGDLPISIARSDGAREMPPNGVINYVELAHGRWTLEPASRPVGVLVVEWPKRCDPEGWIGCDGTMEFVAHVRDDNIYEDGEQVHPAGWQCLVCSRAEVGGLSAVVFDSWEA